MPRAWLNHPLRAYSKSGSDKEIDRMKQRQYVFMTLSVLLLASPAWAQTGSNGGASSFVPLGAGIGMGLASAGCGIGQGLAAAKAAEGFARNPGARAGILLFYVLGLAFIESLALFTLVIVFAVVNK
jgi:F-type H+-transporting ATPase subunit c